MAENHFPNTTPILEVDPNRIEFTGSSGGTDIAAALEVVHETLAREPHADNSLAPLVVLFSDGAPTGADPAPWAKRIKSLPYPADQQPLLVTCGLGQADRSLLQNMATLAEHYKDVPSAFALKEFLAAVGSTLTAAGGAEPNLNRQMRDLIRGT